MALIGTMIARGPALCKGRHCAIAGVGLALLPQFLIREELAGGRLVVAIDRPVTSEYAYYLVYPERKADSQRVVMFRDWLLGQCAMPGREP